jgi:hypothetical protein
LLNMTLRKKLEKKRVVELNEPLLPEAESNKS